MLNDLSSNQQVYLVTGYTDLRRSIDGLAMIIQGQLRLDPFSSTLFLFCGRRRDRTKLPRNSSSKYNKTQAIKSRSSAF